MIGKRSLLRLAGLTLIVALGVIQVCTSSATGSGLQELSADVVLFSEHIVDDLFLGARSVFAIDLDGDNDVDIVAGGEYLAWWENDGDENFTRRDIDTTWGGDCVQPIDLDDDGDIDILMSAYSYNFIRWWENDGSENFSRHTIASGFDGVRSTYAIDLDSDGDLDVLGAADFDDDIAWWENDGSENFTRHTIDADFDKANAVFAIDLDGDNDVDVLGTAGNDDDVAWWENDGDENFGKHTIDGEFDGANAVYAIDLDDDGDVDVLGTASGADGITWWENDGDESFTAQTIDGDFSGANAVFVIDLDDDGDLDVLGTASGADDITWWENDGDENLTKHPIDGEFDGASAVYATDIDGDGLVDVLGAAAGAHDVVWWKQAVPTVASFPFYDGFESGALSTDWIPFTTEQGRVRISDAHPYSGTYSLLLDDGAVDEVYAYAAAILSVDLSGQSQVELGFWWREFDDEDHAEDGVFISDDDGATWHQVFSFNGGANEWLPEVVDIAAAASVEGLTLNDHFQIKFQFFDNHPLDDDFADGYAIDEVMVADHIDVPVVGLAASNDSPTGLGSVTHLAATIKAGRDVTYTWSFDDDTSPAVDSGPAVSHVYADLGTYTAIVTATSPVNVVTATTPVTVVTPVPVAGLTAANDGPTPLGSYTALEADVTAGTNVTYTWAFGDGDTGRGKAVTHTYPALGTYTAVVTATNTENALSAETVVTVTEVPACQQYDFGSVDVTVFIYNAVSWSFTAPFDMHVGTVETNSWLSVSSPRTLYVDVEVNGDVIATAAHDVVSETFDAFYNVALAPAEVQKGDTVRYLVRSGVPSPFPVGGVSGPNYVRLCALPTLSIEDGSAGEGAGTAVLAVTLDVAPALTVTVDYATSDGTATAGDDYTAVGGTLTFEPGVTRQDIDVPLVDDALEEPDETLTVTLSDPDGGTLSLLPSATLTILDNDGAVMPTVGFGSATYEVDEGVGRATLTVTLGVSATEMVTVGYATSDGTAVAGDDYVATSGTLAFEPGATRQTLSVPIVDDALQESDETLTVTLSDPIHSVLGLASATLTILDDDQFCIYLPLVLRD